MTIQVKTVTSNPKRKDQGHGLTLQIAKKKISHGAKRKRNGQMHHQLHHFPSNSPRNQNINVAKMTVPVNLKNLR